MKNFENQVKVNAVGDVDKKASKWGRALDRFGSMGKRSLTTLSRSLPHLSKGLDALGNRYTALLSGGAAYAAVKSAAAMETRLARLGITADKSNAEMRALNEEIYKIAQNRSINVSADAIMSGLEQIVAKTGDFDAADGIYRQALSDALNVMFPEFAGKQKGDLVDLGDGVVGEFVELTGITPVIKGN